MTRQPVYDSFIAACAAAGIDPAAVLYGLRRAPSGRPRKNPADVAERHRVWRRMRAAPDAPSLIRMAGLFGVSHSTIHAAIRRGRVNT